MVMMLMVIMVMIMRLMMMSLLLVITVNVRIDSRKEPRVTQLCQICHNLYQSPTWQSVHCSHVRSLNVMGQLYHGL